MTTSPRTTEASKHCWSGRSRHLVRPRLRKLPPTSFRDLVLQHLFPKVRDTAPKEEAFVTLILPFLAILLRTDLGLLLLIGTLLGSVAIPTYVLSHLSKLALLPPGTEGWNPPVLATGKSTQPRPL